MAITSIRRLSAATALAAALASSASYYDYRDGAPNHSYGGIYDYVPNSGLSTSEIYRSTNGTPFGPPDPATCGGYSC